MLRRYSDGLRLVQRPVRELESLRREKVRIDECQRRRGQPENCARLGAKSEIYEFEAELEPGASRRDRISPAQK